MKAFERIFLYSVLAVLVFYVFLVDSKVESKVAIQEEIRARSISIMNDAGQEVVRLCTLKDNGAIFVANKAGTPVDIIGVNEDGSGLMGIANKTITQGVSIKVDENGGRVDIANKAGTFVAYMSANKYDGGEISIANKAGTFVAIMSANKYDGGEISIANKAGTFVAIMGAPEDYGMIGVLNKHGKVIDTLP